MAEDIGRTGFDEWFDEPDRPDLGLQLALFESLAVIDDLAEFCTYDSAIADAERFKAEVLRFLSMVNPAHLGDFGNARLPGETPLF